MGELKYKYKRSSLVQGGLEIPVKVIVQWEDEKTLEILKRQTEEVSYPFGETEKYQDLSKDILKCLLLEWILQNMVRYFVTHIQIQADKRHPI